MDSDPYQMTNLFPLISQSSSIISPTLNVPWSAIIKRLDSLLMVTKSCKGYVCVFLPILISKMSLYKAQVVAIRCCLLPLNITNQ